MLGLHDKIEFNFYDDIINTSAPSKRFNVNYCQDQYKCWVGACNIIPNVTNSLLCGSYKAGDYGVFFTYNDIQITYSQPYSIYSKQLNIVKY